MISKRIFETEEFPQAVDKIGSQQAIIRDRKLAFERRKAIESVPIAVAAVPKNPILNYRPGEILSGKVLDMERAANKGKTNTLFKLQKQFAAKFGKAPVVKTKQLGKIAGISKSFGIPEKQVDMVSPPLTENPVDKLFKWINSLF